MSGMERKSTGVMQLTGRNRLERDTQAWNDQAGRASKTPGLGIDASSVRDTRSPVAQQR
jgi:hypothetical protein